MPNPPPPDSPDTADLRRLFNTSRAARRKLREVVAMSAPSAIHRCLCIGGEPGVIPAALGARGEWTFLSTRPESREMMEGFLGGRTAEMTDLSAPLPFTKASFDLVVLVDALEQAPNDHVLVAECHRVLKYQGYLVVATRHDKKGLLTPLHSFAGLRPSGTGAPRAGYTQRSLYDLLKDGFDITEFHLSSTFWEQLADLIQQVAAGMVAGRGEGPERIARAATARSVAGVFTSPLILLEAVLGWGKGYQITARARSKIWKERREVKIRDGRSIAEATIRTKIGTAAEF